MLADFVSIFGVPGAFFYEVLVPHLTGAPFRDAVDAAPDAATAWTNYMIEYKEAAGMYTTVFECLRCLFRRFDFDDQLVTRIFSRLSLRTLFALQSDIKARLELPAPVRPVLESDLLTIELACRWTQQKVLKSFPLARGGGEERDVGDSGENWLINQEADKQAVIVKQLVRQLPIVGGRAEEMPRLSPTLHLCVPFQPFDDFELALDSDPFQESGAEGKEGKSSSTLLNLQLRWRRGGMPGDENLREESEVLVRKSVQHGTEGGALTRQHERPESFVEMLDVLEACKATCEQLRYGHHALEPRVAAAMCAALIESTFTSKFPLPEPWRREGGTAEAQRDYARMREEKPENKKTHGAPDGERWLWFAEHAEKPNVVEQRQALTALHSLVEHYLSATFSAAVCRAARTQT